jgi:hypothetical protein
LVLWLLVGVVVAIAFLAVIASRIRPPAEQSPENPNANNPDAFEADLDPEGDEPEGY